MALKLPKKLKNCSACGKLFSAIRNETLCRDCLIKEEEKEREVLDYVREHQGCSIAEVIEAMGVTDKFIRNMISKGLFANIERDDFYYPCQACGKPIKNGTYCSDCLSRLRNETKRMADQMAVRISAASNQGKGTKTKKISELSTIEKLNLQVEKELEVEQSRTKRSMYERIVNERTGRTVGKFKPGSK
ncbi:MAG: hypothetical protein IJ728_01770 [Selenomonadaceae bacterium]|nr:hypothetical protein [Selenomonadaceae bacterium]